MGRAFHRVLRRAFRPALLNPFCASIMSDMGRGHSRMPRFLLVAALSLFAACGGSPPDGPVHAEELRLPVPADWIRVDSGCPFTFRAPADMLKQDVQGIDSCVGIYVNAAIRLTYDYGWYPTSFHGDKADYQDTPAM